MPHSTRISIALTVCAIISVAFAGQVLAQPAQPAGPAPVPAAKAPSQAEALLKKARSLFADQADYVGALEAFQKSFELERTWSAKNGVGVSLMALGRSVEAYDTFEALLAEFGGQLKEHQRARVASFMAELEPKIARVVVELSETNRGATITLDGVSLGSLEAGEPTRVDPGTHAIVANLKGFKSFTKRVETTPGESLTVRIEMSPEDERIVVELKEKRLVRRMPRWVPYAVIGGGAAAAMIGGGFALSAKSDFDAFDESVREGAGLFPRPTPADESLRDGAETKKLVATSMFVAGGAIAITGVVLLIVNQPRTAADKSEDTTPALVITPRSIGMSVRF